MFESSTQTLRIIATVVGGVAQLLTSVRLYYRIRSSQIWLDDAFAAFAMVFAFVGLVTYWIETDTEGVGPLVQTDLSRLRAYWVSSVMWICILWSARVSLVFSSIRIVTSGAAVRRYCYAVAALLGAMWAALIAQGIYICRKNTKWASNDLPNCESRTILITELSFELASHILLILIPLGIFIKIRCSSHQRELLWVLILIALALCGVSAAHGVFSVLDFANLERILVIVEAGVSLILINSTVAIVALRHPSSAPSDDLNRQDSRVQLAKRGPYALKEKISAPTPLSPSDATSMSINTSREEAVVTTPRRRFFGPNEESKHRQTPSMESFAADERPVSIDPFHDSQACLRMPKASQKSTDTLDTSILKYPPQAYRKDSGGRDDTDKHCSLNIPSTNQAVRFLTLTPSADRHASTYSSSIYSQYLSTEPIEPIGIRDLPAGPGRSWTPTWEHEQEDVVIAPTIIGREVSPLSDTSRTLTTPIPF